MADPAAPPSDQWSRWLLETRFGGNAAAAEIGLRRLRRVRDRVLDYARLRAGQTLLDVGCGDGLIGFGALDRLGSAGRVIFSDISRPLLDHCRTVASESGSLDRCAFIETSATALSGVGDESVDAVTTRSVLIYVPDKAAAFDAFFRVLRPGGRISLFEPINRFTETYAEAKAWWRDSPVADLVQRLDDYYRELMPLDTNPMLDFDERDLLRLCEQSGFEEITLKHELTVRRQPPLPWDAAINAPSNPNVPPWATVLPTLFSDEERARFEAYVRPLVEQGGRRTYSAVAFISAVKPA